MDKQIFLTSLDRKLSGVEGVSEEDRERSTEYYSEIIDDRVEEGLSEEEAVKALGSIEEIVSQILAGLPRESGRKKEKEPEKKNKPKETGGIRVWLVVLLVLGAPIWLSLLLGGIITAFALYITLWFVVLSLAIVDLSFGIMAIAGIVCGIIQLCMGEFLQAALFVGIGLIFLGLSIFLFFGWWYAGKGIGILTLKGIKKLISSFKNKKGKEQLQA